MDKEVLIHKALNNQLTQAEQEIFDQLIEKDENFAEAYLLEKDLKSAFVLEARNAVKERLIAHEARLKLKQWYWAAAAVFLIGFFGLFWFLNSPENKPDLFAENYKAFPNLIAPTSRGDEDLTTLFSAMRAYDASNYEEALEQLSEINSTPIIEFYKAQCLLALGKYTQARDLLRQLSLTDNYENGRHWYLALVYLKLEETEKARDELKLMMSSQNPWREDAEELLENLKTK